MNRLLLKTNFLSTIVFHISLCKLATTEAENVAVQQGPQNFTRKTSFAEEQTPTKTRLLTCKLLKNVAIMSDVRFTLKKLYRS